MKLALEIPDTTVCVFFNFVRSEDGGMLMQSNSIGTEKLYDGSEIKIERAEALWNRKDDENGEDI